MLLKSIEQSSYNSTGFLIKLFVTKLYSSHYWIDDEKKYLTNIVYEEFLNSITKRNNDLKNAQLILRESEVNPTYNKDTLDYCTYKLTILLYGQQLYASDNNLPGFGAINPTRYSINMERGLANCDYVDYLFKKLENASDSYGLLFLNDPREEFWLKIKSDIEQGLKKRI